MARIDSRTNRVEWADTEQMIEFYRYLDGEVSVYVEAEGVARTEFVRINIPQADFEAVIRAVTDKIIES